MGRIEFLQAEISGLTTAVAHHPYRNLIGAGSSGPSDPTPSAGRSWQVALSLERRQEKGFVGFDNPAFVRGPMPGYLLSETVTPAEGRVLVDLTASGCASHTDAVDQGLAVAQPLFALA